jgi:hypothetical protein
MQVCRKQALIEGEKSFEHNRPQTTVRLTSEGHKRYVDYLAVLEQVVRDAATAVKEGRGRVPTPSTSNLKSVLVKADDKPPGRTRTVSGVFQVVVQYPSPVPSAQPAMTSVCQCAWLFRRAIAS